MILQNVGGHLSNETALQPREKLDRRFGKDCHKLSRLK